MLVCTKQEGGEREGNGVMEILKMEAYLTHNGGYLSLYKVCQRNGYSKSDHACHIRLFVQF